MSTTSPLESAQSIYFVGIRGVGMSALAVALHSLGKTVAGSDQPTEQETQTHRLLKKYPDIHVNEGFSADHITSAYDFIIAPAVHQGANNPEVKAATALGIPVMYYAEALGSLMDLHKTKISVCGTHGKTTTTTLVAHVMQSLHLSATHIIGASNTRMDSGMSKGRDYIVVESDEYAVAAGIDNTPKFMKLHPDYILCTSLDHDHIDVFPTEESYVLAFKTYFEAIPQAGKVLFCNDIPSLHVATKDIAGKNKISFGLSSESEVYAKDISVTTDGTHFTCVFPDSQELPVTIPLYGDHSVSNCVGVLALAHELQWDLARVAEALATFPGLERRFEIVYSDDDIVYIDDYAHHPSELKAIISAVQVKYPGRRIIALFQPHTYSRTAQFLDGFIESLSLADHTFITDIYGATRENQEDFPITSADIETKALESGITSLEYVPSEELLTHLAAYIHAGDIILTLGAGDATYYLRDDIVGLLESHFVLR